MQPLNWYYRRIRGMSPGEIAWRMRSALMDAADGVRIPLGIVPRLPAGSPLPKETPGFRTTDLPVGAWARDPVSPDASVWAERLKGRAGELLGNRLTYFNLRNAFHGDPTDWHRDRDSGKSAPLRLSQRIDYRDFRVTGDCKMVWEPNRHHHLVVLGRAYRALGDTRFAEAVFRQIASWMDTNPFGYGMNWRSPLELGIRLINWVWALDLVRDREARPPGFDERIRESAWRHLREISRKYSRGSSANNHLIGEAAGVFIGSSYFQELPETRRWREESFGILSDEILRQTHDDGGTREQALGYHLFVLQFFLLAGIVGKEVGAGFPPAYWERVGKMLDFAGALAEGGPLPMFGDCDDGYVLDLAGGGNDVRELLSVGSALLGRPFSGNPPPGCGEAACWLPGIGAREPAERPGAPCDGSRLRSRSFPSTGIYLLQRGARGGEDAVSVLFDCGELGLGAIAAHGHADALSFTMRVGGREVFVDPGTFDYFTYPEWRSYFRSTASHNTMEIDGTDQSEMLGPFLWGGRAHARCTRFDTNGEGGVVKGEHDGYAGLPSPARHIRTIRMDAGFREVEVVDEVRSGGAHTVRLSFHIAEDCIAGMEGANTVRIEAGKSVVRLHIDPALSIRLLAGGENPGTGWVSRGYHRKSSSTTAVAEGTTQGDARFTCRMRISKSSS